ncbi:hypothetical protein ACFOY2_20400 [Nonomuraea purpurea]|uniref:Uncharacterized protein n=1 Tax=Nonomuraea purpurea TaxID=1849276 RepID=A0ABV8GBV1_9ACTN
MLGWIGGAAFAHLEVAEDGTASGRFRADTVFFMPARPHAAPPLESMTLGVGDVSHTKLDPELLRDYTALFVAQLAVPHTKHAWANGDILALHDVESGSGADVRPAEDGGWLVHQHGPLRLWDAVEEVLTVWSDARRPDPSAFTLTVTPDRQWISFGGPEWLSWDLPA